MKKILSWMLALMMLALPVLGLAETAETAETTEVNASSSFISKYTAQGQRSVTEIGLEPGLVLLASLPEEAQTAVKDLLAAVKTQISMQASDEGMQAALRLLLNGEDALDAILATGEKGVYATSSILKDKVLMATPDQLQVLVEKLMDQLVERGVITKEQLDQFKNMVTGAQQDPQAAVQALFGNADPSKLLAELMDLVNITPTQEEVTEIPEGVVIDAKSKMTIVLSRAKLTRVTTELGKFLWSLPMVQQVATAVAQQQKKAPMTEASLVARLNMIPDALSGDLPIVIYANEDGSQMQIMVSDDLTIQNTKTPTDLSIVVEQEENATHMGWNLKLAPAKGTALITGDMTVAVAEGETSTAYEMKAQITEGETTYTVLEENIQSATTHGADRNATSMTATIRVQQQADAQPIGIVVTVNDEEKDLGDHAENAAVVRFALENIGDVVTVNVNTKTDLAEAWIMTDDAVQPMAMNDEERGALLNELQTGLTSGLLGLITKLPESVQKLVTGAFGN